MRSDILINFVFLPLSIKNIIDINKDMKKINHIKNILDIITLYNHKTSEAFLLPLTI
jgi:hypothetical protein